MLKPWKPSSKGNQPGETNINEEVDDDDVNFDEFDDDDKLGEYGPVDTSETRQSLPFVTQ